MTAVTRFAEWLATVSPDHGEEAYRRARDAVFDTVGCILAGRDSSSATAVRATIMPWGEGKAAILGTATRAPAPWAALANGTAAHAMDLDDWDMPATSHPSAVLVPALLALCEERGADGEALLDAYIVGVEVLMRTGEAVNLVHYHRGWHTTSTLGAIAAAAGCARLLGLDATRAGHALGIATSMAAGFKSQFGSTTKPAHAGLAAKSGVLAACLAENGLTAAPETLDGAWSVLTLLAGEQANGFTAPLAKLGAPLAILEHGLIVKRYPCCAYIHRAVDGLLTLRAQHGLTAESARQVRVAIPSRNKEILPFTVPETPSEARFSMEYCLAVALDQGSLGECDFTAEAIARDPVRALIPKIAFAGLPVTAQSSDLATEEADRVAVIGEDGEEQAIEVLYAKGHPRNPLSEAELQAKFEDCAQDLLAPAALVAAQRSLMALSEQSSLTRLTEALVGDDAAPIPSLSPLQIS